MANYPSLPKGFTSNWLTASINSGYGVSGYDSSGKYFNTNAGQKVGGAPTSKVATPSGLTKLPAPTGNVFGMSTSTTDLKGKTSTVKPTENLTGYPVQSTNPNEFTNLASTAVLQNSLGQQVLQSSGNITLWPTIYTKYNNQGIPENIAVVPGELPAGSLKYDENGIPYANNSFSRVKSPSIQSFSTPNPDTLYQETSTNNKIAAQPSQDISKSMSDADLRRRRNAMSFLGFGGL